jgi:hypothetical protein
MLAWSLLIAATMAAEDPGESARLEAEKAGKFLLVFVSDAQADAARAEALKKSVQESATALDKVNAVMIDAGKPEEQGLVKKFRLRYAPKPIALLLAPNGAVVGSFQQPVTAEQLKAGLPSPGMLSCIKALQTGKMVVICVQNKSSVDASAALKGATDFVTDAQYANFATKVVIDPASAEEANTLKQFKIDPAGKKAVSLLLAPPGRVVGKWEGAVTKETISKGLMAAMAAAKGCSSGPGCGDPTCK